jgi:hypothetical protein
MVRRGMGIGGLLLALLLGLVGRDAGWIFPVESAPLPVVFGRDVLPILSTHCFVCHGPDEGRRQAGLRLDLEETAKAPRRTGAAIVPGDPARSGMLRRIEHPDPDLAMPPSTIPRRVTAEEVTILRRWIAEGAPWGRHWSFEPVRRPTLSSETDHPIDQLVDQLLDQLADQTLAARGLQRQPLAPPHQQVRRLWLDLIGLPPTPEVADRFAADPSPEAWRRMVDDLLDRPQFGEHWARVWLDLARYADTKGYEKDLGRTIWPWRDWMIDALNADLPLDRVTEELLAGDLLPNPDQKQWIATAFHRNTMTNDEGGTDNEEFRVAAVKDRVDTTLQVWMGLTVGCAKCHTHKYDPISHREYYQLFAIFNQTEDADRTDDAPTLELATAQQREALQGIKHRQATLQATLPPLDSLLPLNEPWQRLSPVTAAAQDGTTVVIGKDGEVVASGKSPPEERLTVTYRLPPGRYTALRLDALPERLADDRLAVGRHGGKGHFVLSELTLRWGQDSLRISNARAAYAEKSHPPAGAIDGKDQTGWSVEGRGGEPHALLLDLARPLVVRQLGMLTLVLSHQQGDSTTFRRFRLVATSGNPARLSAPDAPAPLRQLYDQLAELEEERKRLEASITRLPVMRELPQEKERETHLHLRGNFLEPGERVVPGLPEAFHPLPEGVKADRRGLAGWLVDPANPLTPRVWTNRIWARLFGVGIVETEEDFGTQGSPPTHPELLDWLAAEYRDRGWSLKELLRTIVTSETYRQSSTTSEAMRGADPFNRLLARGARYRLSSEVLRDQALAIAGLLSSRIGGPPVMPPQPAGLWRSTYSGRQWIDAEGEDRYRRGIYTYLKRTTPYPAMTTFDGGSGEVCQIRRIRTNTPLQALVTLNDPLFWEAAGGLAGRMVREVPASREERLAHGLRLALIRPLRPGELRPLLELSAEFEETFARRPEEAAALLRAARVVVPTGVTPAEMAAAVLVANAILNLDELLTRG